jgi:glycosyltransferase involved in cell wall biosynthesis
VSLVVPAYNEEESLPALAREIREALEAAGLSYELLLVDDGSTDGSLEVMLELARRDPAVRVLRQHPNQGQSAALAAGWRAARAPVVVTLDADLQNDPADVPRLVAALDEGWDVVSGVRVERQDSWTRRASSRIANAVRNRLTGDAVTDVGCTLRACRTELLRDLPVFTGMHRFLPTLLRLQGGRVTEVPVCHRARRFGATKYGVHNRLWRGIVDLLAVRWLQRRWIDRRAVTEVTPERGGGPGEER